MKMRETQEKIRRAKEAKEKAEREKKDKKARQIAILDMTTGKYSVTQLPTINTSAFHQ